MPLRAPRRQSAITGYRDKKAVLFTGGRTISGIFTRAVRNCFDGDKDRSDSYQRRQQEYARFAGTLKAVSIIPTPAPASVPQAVKPCIIGSTVLFISRSTAAPSTLMATSAAPKLAPNTARPNAKKPCGMQPERHAEDSHPNDRT